MESIIVLTYMKSRGRDLHLKRHYGVPFNPFLAPASQAEVSRYSLVEDSTQNYRINHEPRCLRFAGEAGLAALEDQIVPSYQCRATVNTLSNEIIKSLAENLHHFAYPTATMAWEPRVNFPSV